MRRAPGAPVACFRRGTGWLKPDSSPRPRQERPQGTAYADITEASAAPAFIEILNPMKAGQVAGCVLEVQTSSGNHLRLEMKEVSAPDLLTVLRGLVVKGHPLSRT